MYGDLTAFKTAARPSTMLEFKLVQFLTAETVKGPILHHCAKFREDQSSCAWGIANFQFSNIAAATILDFQKIV